MSSAPPFSEPERASVADAEEILALQKLAYESEARLYDDWSLPPLVQTLDSLRGEFARSAIFKVVHEGSVIGSVRARLDNGVCHIGRLIVSPNYQGRGVGSKLLAAAERAFPGCLRFALFTGSRSAGNIRLYERHGYRVVRQQESSPGVTLVHMEKTR